MPLNTSAVHMLRSWEHSLDTGTRLKSANKSFRMFKNYFCGRDNQVGKREAISKLHGFRFQIKRRRFRKGGGRDAKPTTSSRFHFNSPLIHGQSPYPLLKK